MSIKYVCDGCGNEMPESGRLTMVAHSNPPHNAAELSFAHELCPSCFERVYGELRKTLAPLGVPQRKEAEVAHHAANHAASHSLHASHKPQHRGR